MLDRLDLSVTDAAEAVGITRAAFSAFLNGRAEDALNQLKALASKEKLTYYQRARVDARITAMTPIVLDIRKRERRETEPDDTSGNRIGLSTSLRCPNQECPDMSLRRNIPRLQ